MKRLSLKWKLGLLGTFFVLIIGIVGFLQIMAADKLSFSLKDVTMVQLPAVRTMTLVDMMHDGLRAVVYRAIFLSGSNNQKEKQETSDELQEMVSNLTQYMSALDKLDLQPRTKELIHNSEIEVKQYSQSAQEIVALSLEGKKDLAVEKLPNFQIAFEALEEKLGSLGETIEKDAENSKTLAETAESSAHQISYIIIALGILLGLSTTMIFTQKLSSDLKKVASHLDENAHQVALAAEKIASSSQGLSESTTEQAASLAETAASLEEITAMIGKSSENSSITAENASESQSKAQEGKEAVDHMLVSIEEISRSNDEILTYINESNRRMTEITTVIQDIGNKTKVINEIVFQTKLLSFNASVEAARAGEHGKGFAVVAEEVGNLAQMSGNAAKEISDMLSSSISKVDEIVNETRKNVETLVQSGKGKVEAGIQVANRCSQILEEITNSVSQVTRLSHEIHSASKEQSQGVTEINKAISQLDVVTQNNASTSEQTAGSAEQLSGQADSLNKSVGELMRLINGSSAVS